MRRASSWKKGQFLAFKKSERDDSCDFTRVIRCGGLNTWDTVFLHICQEVVSENEPIVRMRKCAQTRAGQRIVKIIWWIYRKCQISYLLMHALQGFQGILAPVLEVPSIRSTGLLDFHLTLHGFLVHTRIRTPRGIAPGGS